MNTAMKLLMKLNGAVYSDVADDMPSGGVTDVPEVEPEVVPEDSDKEEIDWLLEDDMVTPKEEPIVEPEVEVEPEVKEEPQVEPEKKEEQPTEVPKEEPKVEDPTPEQTQAPTQLTPEQIAERKEAFRAGIEKEFAISEEDANLLVTAPEKVYPKLASNLMMRTLEEVQAMQEAFLKALPQIIQTVNTQTVQETETKNRFMELTPVLKNVPAAELDEAVKALAPIVKQRYPNATLEERMAVLGKMIAVANGLDLNAAVKKPAAKSPVAAKPYTPAAPARSSVPAVNQPKTQLEKEIEDLLNSDD